MGTLRDELRLFHEVRAMHTRVVNELRDEPPKDVAKRTAREDEIAEQLRAERG